MDRWKNIESLLPQIKDGYQKDGDIDRIFNAR